MKKCILIPAANNPIRVLDVPEDFGWEWMRDQIGCELIEIVRPRGLPRGYVMVVDEEGLLNGKWLNIVGCNLYGTRNHGHPIVGDILILKETYGLDGAECEGMDDDEVEEIFNLTGTGEGDVL